MSTLPYGHDLSGYVSPDLSFTDGVGTLPSDEQQAADDQNAAQATQAQEVADYESQVAGDIRDERLDTSGVKLASIDPSAIQCGESDQGALMAYGASPKSLDWVTLNVYGSGFDPTTNINYDGDDITSTVFVSPTQLQMTLNPAGATPRYVPIKVAGDPADTVLWLAWTPGPTHD